MFAVYFVAIGLVLIEVPSLGIEEIAEGHLGEDDSPISNDRLQYPVKVQLCWGEKIIPQMIRVLRYAFFFRLIIQQPFLDSGDQLFDTIIASCDATQPVLCFER